MPIVEPGNHSHPRVLTGRGAGGCSLSAPVWDGGLMLTEDVLDGLQAQLDRAPTARPLVRSLRCGAPTLHAQDRRIRASARQPSRAEPLPVRALPRHADVCRHGHSHPASFHRDARGPLLRDHTTRLVAFDSSGRHRRSIRPPGPTDRSRGGAWQRASRFAMRVVGAYPENTSRHDSWPPVIEPRRDRRRDAASRPERRVPECFATSSKSEGPNREGAGANRGGAPPDRSDA